MTTKKWIEDVVADRLKDNSLEDLLEDFDITPEECFWILFSHGHIDKELFLDLYQDREFDED